MYESPKRPGGAFPEWQQFDVKVDVDSGRTKGFTALDGKHYALGEGEEIVFVKKEGGKYREPMIRTTMSFEDWKAQKENE